MPKVIMYTTDYCSFCRAAKNILHNKGVEVEEINVEDDDEKRAWLVKTTGKQTVPQIFIDDKPIGGFRDLQALEVQGKLDEILGLK